MSENRLLVLDGHSLAFRAFFSRPPENFRTTNGVYTNAVHGFFSMLLAMIRKEKPTHIGAAFDLSRHSFRTDIYPEYKAGRKDTPEEFIGQVENIQRMLDAMSITWLTLPNVEADDILATLAKQGEAHGMEVLISSGDRDSFQLIDEHVTVLYPGRSISQTARMTPQAVKDKYDVWPWQYPQIAALVGEKADNLPGVPLVGEKVAAGWINEFGSLDDLLQRREEVGGKRGENLRAHVADVERNRELNRLRTDLHLPVKLEDLRWGGPDAQAVNAMCEELEFKELRRQIFALPGVNPGTSSTSARPASSPSTDSLNSSDVTQVGKTADSPSGMENTAQNQAYGEEPEPRIHQLEQGFSPSDLGKWLNEAAGGEVSVWALGHLAPTNGRIDWLFLARDAEEAVLVTLESLSSESENTLAAFLKDESVTKVVYDAKALRHALKAQGWSLSENYRDINLLDYLADPDESRLKFASVSQRLLGWSIEEKPSEILKISEQMAFDLGLGGDFEAPVLPQVLINQAKYACGLLQMLPILEEKIRLRRVDKLLEMEVPLSYLLERMEETGVKVDAQVLENFAAELRNEAEKAQETAFSSIGREVNLASPKQLQDVLFNQLGLPPTKKIKTGYTTDAKSLEELALYNPHPFLEALLYHRDRTKLLQIVRNLLERISDDGRIHTTYGQTIAATGRLSSIDPNLQNIPARTQDGSRIREAFVAEKPFENLMTADYSQIEMRIMAHLSKDEGLIAAFNSGEDLHRSVAALVFGVEPAEVTPTQRSHVKATSYGLAYGLSAYGLAGQLRISQTEAKHLMETYFSRFGAVRDYLEHIVEEARRVGYTETMWGRRRYLPGLRSTNRQVEQAARRAALNAPIQGSAADLMKQAMLKVDAALKQAKLDSRVLLQVHDELIFEVAKGEDSALAQLVKEAMTTVTVLEVPLEVSIGVGTNWRNAAH